MEEKCSEQYIECGGKTVLVYKYCGDDLIIGRAFKKLYPVFVTANQYVLGITTPNDEVLRKEASTRYTSVSNTRQGCEYLSWRQVSPSGLSWLIPSDVIQFLTSQLVFDIKWRITRITADKGEVTFAVPYPGGVAYELPDIKGDKIEFKVSNKVGGMTYGSFKVPAQYFQFVISVPARNIRMDMIVTGSIAEVDKYDVSDFYVKVFDCEVFAYRNVLSTTQLERKVAPTFATLELLMKQQIVSKPFFPCSPFDSSQGMQGTESVTFSMTAEPFLNGRRCTYNTMPYSDNVQCAYSYSEPIFIANTVPTNSIIIPPSSSNSPYFGVINGTYDVVFEVTGESLSYNDLKSTAPYGGTTRFACDELAFMLISGNNIVQYDPSNSNPGPHLTEDLVITPSLTVGPPVQGPTAKVQFSLPSSSPPYSYRVKVENAYATYAVFSLRIVTPIWNYGGDNDRCGCHATVTMTWTRI